jgi:hypothetical protein
VGFLSEELRAQIGRTASYTAPEPLGRAAIRYYALALGDPDPRHTSGMIAPPTLICETNQYAAREPDAVGYAGHSWDLGVPGTLVRGGNSYEFHADAGPDTILTATWRLVDMAERTTRDGRPMLTITSEARYTDQHGTLLAVNSETVIYLGETP